MVRPHQGISTGLSQSLVTEINIQECLDLIVRTASKDVIGPQASVGKKEQERLEAQGWELGGMSLDYYTNMLKPFTEMFPQLI